jgi:hypothetical protein
MIVLILKIGKGRVIKYANENKKNDLNYGSLKFKLEIIYL